MTTTEHRTVPTERLEEELNLRRMACADIISFRPDPRGPDNFEQIAKHARSTMLAVEDSVRSLPAGNEPVGDNQRLRRLLFEYDRAAEWNSRSPQSVRHDQEHHQAAAALAEEVRSALVDVSPNPEKPNTSGERVNGSSTPPGGTVEQCATEGCENPATERFESGGVGSWYCRECFDNVRALASPPAPASEPVAWAKAEPTHFAIYGDSGVHIGTWTDRVPAERVVSDYPGATILPLYASPVAPHVAAVTEEMVDAFERGALTGSSGMDTSDPRIAQAIKNGRERIRAGLVAALEATAASTVEG